MAGALEALKAEMEAANVAIEPQIRGYDDLSRASLSQNTLDQVALQAQDTKRRHDLIGDVIGKVIALIRARDALFADGYPALPKHIVSQQVQDELREQQSDFLAALSQFQTDAPPAPASNIAVTLGAPAPKAKP